MTSLVGYLPAVWKEKRQVASLKLTWPLKMVVSNRNFLFQGFIFRGYVSFREGSYYFLERGMVHWWSCTAPVFFFEHLLPLQTDTTLHQGYVWCSLANLLEIIVWTECIASTTGISFHDDKCKHHASSTAKKKVPWFGWVFTWNELKWYKVVELESWINTDP